MHPASSKAILACAIAALICVSGCSNPKGGQVRGKVSAAGQPLASVVVTFHAANDNGHVFTGNPTGADGLYELKYAEALGGVVTGRYKVTVEVAGVLAGPDEPARDPLEPNGARKPSIYTNPNTTPLTAEVVDGPNTLDFDLPSM